MAANSKPAKSETISIWTIIHCVIGIGFMILFYVIPPIEPITEVGMKIMGTFLGMVYLWSAVDSIWPSLLGIVLMGFSGITGNGGAAGLREVTLQAYGTEQMLVLAMGMILFGAVAYVGCTQYLARWFMTRKIINGRPYIFMFIFFFASYFLSGLTNPIASLLILWPISKELLNELGASKDNKLYPLFAFGVYLAATLGQPMFPFKGAALVITAAFTRITEMQVNYLAYVALNVVMSVILLIVFILYIKFIARPDITPIKNINIEQFQKSALPPMNFQQKLFMWFVFVYIVLLLAPSFLPAAFPGVSLLKELGTWGVTIVCTVVLMVIHYKGKPALPFKAVAAKSFSWDVYFMVASALYGANAVSNDLTGIKEFLIQSLQPYLGGKPQVIFLFLILGFAMITTNFANNAGMAVVLLPVIMAFADQYPGVHVLPICMTVCMMVFVAILTPAASPFAGMLHAQKDSITFKQIIEYGVPICIAALTLYVFIGYPLADFLFAL